MNTYYYVLNAPTSGKDPTGHETKKTNAVFGDVNLHRNQGLRGSGLISEHVDPIAAQRLASTNPATGNSPVPAGRGSTFDRNSLTVVWSKAAAAEKTRLDNQVINAAKAELKAGGLSTSTAQQLTPEAGLARMEAAGRTTGTPVPAGARVAVIGQIDAKSTDSGLNRFFNDVANNPVTDISDADINQWETNASLESAEVSSLGMTSVAVEKNPSANTVFKGNFVEVTDSSAVESSPTSSSPFTMMGSVNRVGSVAGNLTRATVPGVAEAEAGLVGAAYVASGSSATASLVTPLLTAAEAVPVVGAGIVAGGIVGNAAENVARANGFSAEAANNTGALAAGLTGAGIGALIGAPTGVGAPIGAVLGFASGVSGYYLSKWLS